MNWGPVPAYLRPVDKRDDLGLLMRYRWSDKVRRLWLIHVEMGKPLEGNEFE